MNTADRERRLKKIYLDSLPARLEELRSMFDNILIEKQAEQTLLKLYRLAHNLAGSSATYGFEEIGDKAAEMEDWFEGFVESNTLPLDTDKTQFNQLFDKLLQTSEQALATVAPS